MNNLVLITNKMVIFLIIAAKKIIIQTAVYIFNVYNYYFLLSNLELPQ